jgi:hypothetical protein
MLMGMLLPADILGDMLTGITLFLPDNEAVNATLTKKGLDLPGLLKVQSLCEQIIAYHILPSPIEVRTPAVWSPAPRQCAAPQRSLTCLMPLGMRSSRAPNWHAPAQLPAAWWVAVGIRHAKSGCRQST